MREEGVFGAQVWRVWKECKILRYFFERKEIQVCVEDESINGSIEEDLDVKSEDVSGLTIEEMGVRLETEMKDFEAVKVVEEKQDNDEFMKKRLECDSMIVIRGLGREGVEFGKVVECADGREVEERLGEVTEDDGQEEKGEAESEVTEEG